jgi:antitoxin component YwqK of YwqJK toxin-antitoxin module
MTTEQTISSFGFYPSGSCDCGGIRNDKYRNGAYVIYIRNTKKQFKIKRKNEVVVPLKSLDELEKSLQETFPEPVA